jgi:hypothetical protein
LQNFASQQQYQTGKITTVTRSHDFAFVQLEGWLQLSREASHLVDVCTVNGIFDCGDALITLHMDTDGSSESLGHFLLSALINDPMAKNMEIQLLRMKNAFVRARFKNALWGQKVSI